MWKKEAKRNTNLLVSAELLPTGKKNKKNHILWHRPVGILAAAQWSSSVRCYFTKLQAGTEHKGQKHSAPEESLSQNPASLDDDEKPSGRFVELINAVH